MYSGENVLMFREEDVEALTFLGLSHLQARVYLSLVNRGADTAKKISRNADVARQDVYRIVAELEKIRLIEKEISSPTKYRPIPMEDAVDVLLGRKQKENLDSMDKAKELLERFQSNHLQSSQDEEVCYVLIPPKEAFIKKSKEFHEMSRSSIDIFTTIERARVAIAVFQDDYEKATKRGVNVRFLIGITEDQSLAIVGEKSLTQSPFFDLNVVEYSPKRLTPFVIWDQKDMFIVTTEKEELYQSQNLFTNNPFLIELLHNYFELMWKNSWDSI
jgi:sugar-specific transcriptional regulator TrmB